jgi:hypothetical protein
MKQEEWENSRLRRYCKAEFNIIYTVYVLTYKDSTDNQLIHNW